MSIFRSFPPRKSPTSEASPRDVVERGHHVFEIGAVAGISHRLKAFGRALIGRRGDVSGEANGETNPPCASPAINDASFKAKPQISPQMRAVGGEPPRISLPEAVPIPELHPIAAASAHVRSSSISEADRDVGAEMTQNHAALESDDEPLDEAPMIVAKTSAPEPFFIAPVARSFVVVRKSRRKLTIPDRPDRLGVAPTLAPQPPALGRAMPVVRSSSSVGAQDEASTQSSRGEEVARGPKSESGGCLLKTAEIMRILRGDVSIAQDLAGTGRVDATDLAGDSALHIAARRGRQALCSALLEVGADLDLQNLKGIVPRDILGDTGVSELISAPVSAAKLPEPLAHASASTLDQTLTDAHPASDLDFEFDLNDDIFEIAPEEEASDFHARTGFSDAAATFERVGPVDRIDSADGGAIAWGNAPSHIGITGDDLTDVSEPKTDKDLERVRDTNFLSVSKGRRSRLAAVAPTTEGFLLLPEDCAAWLDDALAKGFCTAQDVDELSGLCRGDFPADMVAANLCRELEACGLLTETGGGVLDPVVPEINAEALLEALKAAATRSNRAPGDKAFTLSRSRERHLFADFYAARRRALEAIMNSPADRAFASCWADDVLNRRIASVGTLVSFTSVTRDNDEELAFVTAADALRGAEQGDVQVILDGLQASISFFDIAGELSLSEDVERSCQSLRGSYEEILQEHLPITRRMAARRTPDGEDVEDVFQDAFLGLERSLWKFDPNMGARFMTYASFWIRQYIVRQRADLSAIIRFPVHRREMVDKLEALIAEHERLAFPPPSTAQIEDALQVDAPTADYLLRLPRTPVVFSEDCLELNQPDAFDAVHERQREERIAEVLDCCNEREQDILRRRFGFGDDTPCTLEEIAETYGVTRERIRQIEAKALSKIGHPARLRTLRELL